MDFPIVFPLSEPLPDSARKVNGKIMYPISQDLRRLVLEVELSVQEELKEEGEE